MDFWSKNWKTNYSDAAHRKPIYDLWLDNYPSLLESSRTRPIIDLGCGMGGDSLYLTELGYDVIACDLSELAIAHVKASVPRAQTMVFDMLDGLPFESSSAYIIIADLSLHYFSWDDTVRVVADIKRVLKDGGHLLCRLNSTEDYACGAGGGIPIEDNYYLIEDSKKRFFDKAQINHLFKDWRLHTCRQYEMNRYKRPKLLWEVAAEK